jgi:hypothetical protein
VGRAHERGLLGCVGEEVRRDLRRPLDLEVTLARLHVGVAVAGEALHIGEPHRAGVNDIAARARDDRAEGGLDGRRRVPVPELVPLDDTGDAPREGQGAEDQHPRPADRLVGEPALLVVAKVERGHEGGEERGGRAGAVRDEARKIDDRVVERPPEVADERVVGEDHRAQVEAANAEQDGDDRASEREEHRGDPP